MVIRRISRVRAPVAAAASVKTRRQMIETLKSIAKMQETYESLGRNIIKLSDVLQKDMEDANLKILECEDAIADIVRSAGKTSNVIDVRKFFKKVGGATDDFFASISVGVTKAKEILGQKELDKIMDSTPGKPGEPKLKVTLRK